MMWYITFPGVDTTGGGTVGELEKEIKKPRSYIVHIYEDIYQFVSDHWQSSLRWKMEMSQKRKCFNVYLRKLGGNVWNPLASKLSWVHIPDVHIFPLKVDQQHIKWDHNMAELLCFFTINVRKLTIKYKIKMLYHFWMGHWLTPHCPSVNSWEWS